MFIRFKYMYIPILLNSKMSWNPENHLTKHTFHLKAMEWNSYQTIAELKLCADTCIVLHHLIQWWCSFYFYISENLDPDNRDHFMYAPKLPSQWETMLHCNVSHCAGRIHKMIPVMSLDILLEMRHGYSSILQITDTMKLTHPRKFADRK